MQDHAQEKRLGFILTLRRTLTIMHQKDPRLTVMIILTTITTLITTMVPVLFPRILLGRLLNTSVDLPTLAPILIGYFLLMLTASVVQSIAHGYSNSRFSLVRLNFMGDLIRKYLKIDYDHIEDPQFMNITQEALESTSMNDRGFELLLHMTFKLPAILISILLITALITYYSPWILAAILLNAATHYLVKNATEKNRYTHRSEEETVRRRIQYYSTQTSDFSFGKDIRIFGLSGMLREGFGYELTQLTRLLTRIYNKEFRWSLLVLLTRIGSLAWIIALLFHLHETGLPIETIAMLLTATTSLRLHLESTIDDLVRSVAKARYVADSFAYLDLPNRASTYVGPTPELNTDTLEIQFKDVSFKYPGSNTRIFDKLNFTLHKGEKLAIVGVNGAGKTTLVKLLTGLFQPTEGEILINGIPQSHFTPLALYQLFACVFQDYFIMPFDIRTNIVMTNRQAPDNVLWDILDQVDLKDKVEQLPQQLDQRLNRSVYDDAVNLSGGEAQKLTLARALYKGSPMIILDEPTAALDALAEQAIYQNFSRLVQGKTTLFISHRLASTQFCDRILLIDGQGIGEMGTHDELLAQHGKYYEMFMTQGKYYREEAPIHA